jgi:hypothetical protein
MSPRQVIALAMLSCLALAACDTGSGILGVGGGRGATVRIVNASGVALDLTSNGQVVGGSGHVPAGAITSCLRIDPSLATVGLRRSGETSDIPGFAPVFAVGGVYTVIAFPGIAGAIATSTTSDIFTPATGLSGLRIFDAAPDLGTLDVYVTLPGEPLSVPSSASVGFGGSTGFFDVNPGTSQVRFTIATTPVLVFDAGQITLAPGQNSTLVLAQPAGASSAPVTMLVPGC